MKIVCMIPARLGSTRVKNKNIRLLGNKPLIQHIAESAKKSKYLNETITFVGHDGRSSTIKNIIIGNYNIIKTLREHNKNLSILIYLYKRLFPKILDKIKLLFR